MFLIFLLAPLQALFNAFIRGLVLCLPVMIVAHYLHQHMTAFPNWSLLTSFLVVAMLSLLVPTGTVTVNRGTES